MKAILCKPREQSGIWEGFIPGIEQRRIYKYHILPNITAIRWIRPTRWHFMTEKPPRTASIVWDLDYAWTDQKWMARRRKPNALNAPISIYEVHLGSWMRVPEEDNRSLDLPRDGAQTGRLCNADGLYPRGISAGDGASLHGSWGYQTTGYFAPTSRYGTPQDFMYLVDYLHRYDIGVILDWVPSHFPTDEHGLGFFDGTHLYEHADPRQGFPSGLEQLYFQLRPE